MRAHWERHHRLGFEILEDRLTPSWAGTPPDTVPTSDLASAAQVTLNRYGDARGNATITSEGEVDWYRFTAVNGMYSFGAATPRSRVDTVIGVYDQSGQLLASNDDVNRRNTDSLVSVTLTAGTYYLGVTNYADATHPATPGRYSWAVLGPTVGTAETPFHITLRLTGISPARAVIFQRAADRWSQVITSDLPDTTFNGVPVDDLLIDASASYIDGRGRILGDAGPGALRSDSGLPYYGGMEFDSADLAWLQASGGLYYTVLHEMGHVLGIGSLWGQFLDGPSNNPVFTGTNAVAAFNDVFHTSVTGVPVENRGGPGTAFSHWRESVFRNELMTGYLNAGRNPLSRVTVAALADLGYDVNLNAADPYVAPVRFPAALSSSGGTAGAASLLGPAQPAAGLFAPPGDDLAGALGGVALPPELWTPGDPNRAPKFFNLP